MWSGSGCHQLQTYEPTNEKTVVVHLLCPKPSSEPRNRQYAGTKFYLACNCGEVDFDKPPIGHSPECAVSIAAKVQQVRRRLDEAQAEIPLIFGEVKTVGAWVPVTKHQLSDALLPEFQELLRQYMTDAIDKYLILGYGNGEISK